MIIFRLGYLFNGKDHEFSLLTLMLSHPQLLKADNQDFKTRKNRKFASKEGQGTLC